MEGRKVSGDTSESPSSSVKSQIEEHSIELTSWIEILSKMIIEDEAIIEDSGRVQACLQLTKYTLGLLNATLNSNPDDIQKLIMVVSRILNHVQSQYDGLTDL